MHQLLTSIALVASACGGTSARPEPRCPAHAVVLTSQAAIDDLAHCTQLGGVTLRSGARLDASRLAALVGVRGDLVIGPTIAMSEIALPALARVDGAIRMVGNAAVQGVFLPRLERAGSIAIDGNVALATVSLPQLVRVTGALRITDNAALEIIDVAKLAALDGELVIHGAPRLGVVEATALRSAAAVAIEAPMLAPAQVIELRQIAPN